MVWMRKVSCLVVLILLFPAIAGAATSICPPVDLTGDCLVDLDDFSLLSFYWMADEIFCSSGFEDCDADYDNGCEVHVLADANHCGSCNNVCPNGGTCLAGVCQCGSGLVDCNGQCVDLASDTNHCGSCNSPCFFPNATAICQSGTCDIDFCDSGFEDCDGDSLNGCEVYLPTDSNHCGSCGNTCPGGSICSAGACQCGSGLTDCGSQCVDLNTDSNNCGTCNNACTGGSVCSSGACLCTAGLSNCFGQCVDLDIDANNCGTCGTDCSNAPNVVQAFCQNGMCDIADCAANYADCDALPFNGCETNLDSDSNCGACGNTCPGGFICSGGVCQCSGGLVNCGGQCVDLANDVNNCGGCNNVCSGGDICEFGSCTSN